MPPADLIRHTRERTATEDATWWVAGSVPGISGEKDKAGFGAMLGGIADGVSSGAITLTPLPFTAEHARQIFVDP